VRTRAFGSAGRARASRPRWRPEANNARLPGSMTRAAQAGAALVVQVRLPAWGIWREMASATRRPMASASRAVSSGSNPAFDLHAEGAAGPACPGVCVDHSRHCSGGGPGRGDHLRLDAVREAVHDVLGDLVPDVADEQRHGQACHRVAPALAESHHAQARERSGRRQGIQPGMPGVRPMAPTATARLACCRSSASSRPCASGNAAAGSR
jgi:hypothetical protein